MQHVEILFFRRFFFLSLPTCRQFRGHCWQRPRTHGLLKQKQEHTVSSFSTPSDGHLASRLPSRARGSSPLIKTVSGFQSYNITRRTYLTVCFFSFSFYFFGLSVQNPSNLSFRKSYKSHWALDFRNVFISARWSVVFPCLDMQRHYYLYRSRVSLSLPQRASVVSVQ